METRRSLLFATGALSLNATLAGCAKAWPERAFSWSEFKKRFFLPDGRIVDTGNGAISHSEGQGYGLLMSEASNDQDSFDKIWRWTKQTLGVRPDGLFAWKYDPGAVNPIGDPNNATDGDVLIAWALHRASRRWAEPSYAKASEDVRAAILRVLVQEKYGKSVLLPATQGFDHDYGVVLNPSYYIWPALDVFSRVDGEDLWGAALKDGLELTSRAKFGVHALPADWTILSSGARLRPTDEPAPNFGFDAVRVPLYLCWSGRSALADTTRAYWADLQKRQVQVPAWVDLKTGALATYPLSNGGLSVYRLLLGAPLQQIGLQDGDYYSNALAHLAWLASFETSFPQNLFGPT